MIEANITQPVAIKLYRTADRLTLAAPVPGLLPQDISIEVTRENQLIIRGPLRGITADAQLYHRMETPKRARKRAPQPVEETRELLLDEWSAGPYRRVVELPNPVNGKLATATHGNGVLVVTLPITKRTTAAEITLVPIGVGRGEYVGSVGHPIQRTTTQQHVQTAHPAV